MECKPLSFGHVEASPSAVNGNTGIASIPKKLATNTLQGCAYCHATNMPLSLCKKCELVWYCGEGCQKVAQDAHQLVCNYRVFVPKDDEDACLFREGNGNVRTMTQKEFRERTNSTYVNGPIFTLEALAVFNHDRMNYQKLENTGFSKSIGLQYFGDKIGYGTVAVTDILAKAVVGDYGSVVIPTKIWDSTIHTDREHAFAASGGPCEFDPSVYASLGAYVNDGPPNCILATFQNPHVVDNGLEQAIVPLRKKLIITQNVKKGEQLLWDYKSHHPVKLGYYTLEKQTLDRFLAKYSNHLNIAVLKERGSVVGAIDFNYPHFIEAMDVEYILATPFILAKLHLDSNLYAASSLREFKALPVETQRNYGNAKLILEGLCKILSRQKQEFSKILSSISGLALIHVCDALAHVKSTPSTADLEKFGRLYDRMYLLHVGSFHSNYWKGAEQYAFRKLFEEDEYQEKIRQVDAEALAQLPSELHLRYRALKGITLSMTPIEAPKS